MRESKIKQVVVVGQLPPPIHGQSVAIERIVGIRDAEFEIQPLAMNCSDDIEIVGHFQFRKIWVTLRTACRLLKLSFGRSDLVVYYPPASPEPIPVLRDILFFTFARLGVRRWVFHFHAGGLPEMLSGHPLGRLAGWFYPRPRACISMSRDSEPTPGRFFGGRDFYIPYGMDIPLAFETRPRGEPRRLLFVGNLFISKGVGMCLQAVRELLDRGLQVHLDLVGGHVDRDRQRIFDLIEEFDVSRHVTFHGVLSGDEKWARFKEAECFVFPSEYPAEKFPNVLIEALGAGLPVVTTRWRGIPELLGDSVEGSHMIEPGDLGAFCQCIEKVIRSNDEDYERFRRASRKRYEARYTLNEFNRSVLDTFRYASGEAPNNKQNIPVL